MGFAVCRYFHVTDFLERFTAQCPWNRFRFPRQGEMLEVDFIGMSLFISYTANLLKYGKIMSGSIDCLSFIFRDKCLIVVDELFRQLPESQILDLVLMLDELSESQPHIVIAGISTFGTVNTDTCLDVITDNIGHFHKGHLRFHAALKKVFHIGGIEINFAFHKIVECHVYRQ